LQSCECLIDLSHGAVVAGLEHRRFPGSVVNLAFASNTRLVAVTDAEDGGACELQVYDLEAGVCVRVAEPHNGPGSDVAVASSELLACAGQEGTVCLFDLRAAPLRPVTTLQPKQWQRSAWLDYHVLTFSPVNPAYLAASVSDNSVIVFDTRMPGTELHRLRHQSDKVRIDKHQGEPSAAVL
jgi:WD40 repeat protein